MREIVRVCEAEALNRDLMPLTVGEASARSGPGRLLKMGSEFAG